jgi:hypothetical protein
MTTADQYRVKALEFTAMASKEMSPHLQVAYAGIAQSYFRLAVLAEQNAKTDVVYETPPTQNPPTP